MLVLLKSVLSSLPTYFLSLFQVPCSVLDQLDRLQRDFLWGSTLETKSIHWVGWNKICRPMDQGGLGIRSIRETNRALLNKWLWRFGGERDDLWRRVVASKYGEDCLGWALRSLRGAGGLRGVEEHIEGDEIFLQIYYLQN